MVWGAKRPGGAVWRRIFFIRATAGESPESGDASAQPPGEGPGVRTISAAVSAVRGHLGAFEIDVIVDEEIQPLAPSLLTAHRPFDIVLDLCDPPFIGAEVPPPGYFAARRGFMSLSLAIEDAMISGLLASVADWARDPFSTAA